MLSLLINTCFLMLTNLVHCLLYSIPTQIAFAVSLYMLQNDVDPGYTFAGVVVFFIANTLFIYAAVGQILKQEPGSVDFAGALRWRREHNDFFIFVALGMIIFTLLSIYFIDAVDYLLNQITVLRKLETDSIIIGSSDIVTNSYSVLVAGSRFFSVLLLIATLFIWLYICRAGIRIPAYIEGYYLRTDEAMQLTRHGWLSLIAISFLFIIAITTFIDLMATGLPSVMVAWVTPCLWAGGYFFIITAHLAMWVHLYKINIKAAGYRMSILQL